MPAAPYEATADGLRLRVRVTPNASRDGCDGLHEASDGSRALKVRVRALPEKGRANKAVAQVVAKALGVPKSVVQVASGARDRTKVLAIAGETSRLTRAVDALIDAGK